MSINTVIAWFLSYLDKILETHPWDTRRVREISQGLTCKH